MNRRLSVLLGAGALLVAAGCGGNNQSADAQSSDAILSGTVLTCQHIAVQSGGIGSGQYASNLATAQLTGTKDVWNDYVEFRPGTSAICSYSLTTGLTAGSVSGLSLRVNYRGPTKAAMRWLFEALDVTTGAWVSVGDNQFAQDWTWTAATLQLPSPASRFIANGTIQIRYRTTSNADSSDLDQLILLASTATMTDGGTTTVADAGTTTAVDAGTTTVADAGVPSSSGTVTGVDAGTTTPTVDAGTTSSGGSVDAGSPPPLTTTADAGTTSSGSTGSYWQPHPGTTWQIQLTGTIDTSVNVEAYDIDLFDTPASTIASLHAQGRKVICYFSAGSYEDWRPDASQFPASVKGSPLQGWPGEWWLDIRSPTVRSIMEARMDLAVQKACDAVDPDNVDEYTNSNGLSITAADQLDYNTFLATQAHARGLAVGLKNDVDQVPQLVSSFDFTVNEQCFQYNECNTVVPFISNNKPVFNIEYGSSSLATSVCPKANSLNIDTLIKDMNLDAVRTACR